MTSGGSMVRDGRLLEQTFSRRPEYYRGGGDTAREHDSHDSDSLDFYRLGFEGTRRWRALKLWMSWKHLGTRGLGRLVAANVAIARYPVGTRRRIRRTSSSCRRRPSCRWSASATCRGGPRPAPDELDAHQDALQAALEASGDGWLSTTRLRGSTWLRAGVMNPMTTEADIDRLLGTLRELA